MKKVNNLIKYFTKVEWILWVGSLILIIVSFLIWDRTSYLNLFASLIGVTSLIFNAKGNPIGQILMVVFSIIYGVISYSSAYYGEMITYLGMTAPMAVFAFISWIKNPYKNNRSEVKVNSLSIGEYGFMSILTMIVTIGFYFILRAFNTSSLIISTLSVTTSFVAVYLTFRRSNYYALGYALNDIVLIVLWIIATNKNITYLSMVICFSIFLINDLYGFIAWSKMKRKQENSR